MNMATISGRFFSSSKLPMSPELPVLRAMIEAFKATRSEKSWDELKKRTAVVYVHHALKTSPAVVQAMFDLFLSPKNTFVLGKRYSDNREVIEKMKSQGLYYQPSSEQSGLGAFNNGFTRDVNLLWAEVVKQLNPNEVKNVLILDHGGYAANFVPSSILERFNVVGLEKTSGGLKGSNFGPAFPLISVANCAAKKFLESPLIAEAILSKLKPVIDMTKEPTECGVVGYGTIGKAVAEILLSKGHRVIVYDKNPIQLQVEKSKKNLVVTSELSSLVNFSKLIFGCSGCDITEAMDAFRLAPEAKTLISCSSEDVEFQTLLKYIQKMYNGKARAMANSFSDVAYVNDFGKSIHILRAGFPYNFDSSGESVPANDIQLTRGLVLAGVLQAIDFLENSNISGNSEVYALDAGLQQFVVQEWLKYQDKKRFAADILKKFEDASWVEEHSQGIKEPLSFSLNNNMYTKKMR